MAAVSVVARSHLVFRLDFADSVKPFGVAEAVVRFSFFHKFHGVFFVKVEAFALDVRSVFAAL